MSVVGATWRGSGAVADAAYDGFSLCHYTGDSAEHSSGCRAALADRFGVGPERVVVPGQVHGTAIATITSADFDPATIEGVDAVITTVPKLIVGVNTADCIPVVLVDDRAGMVAAVHAGWRGAVAGIAGLTVEAMRRLGAGELTAVIGAGICSRCFEVGPEVSEQFPQRFVTQNPGERPHVDLLGYVAHELINSGITDIINTGWCTRCNPERFFSARALGIASGRNYTFAMLF